MIKLNTNKVTFFEFPNEEVYFKQDCLDTDSFCNVVTFKFESNKDLMDLFMLKKYLDEYFPHSEKLLQITYMPYSRADRKIDNYPFTLKYVSEFINSLNFNEVRIYEPHSIATRTLVRNSRRIDKSIPLTLGLIQREQLDVDETTIFYPDKGARDRFGNIFDMPIIHAEKKRNLQTGKIISYELNQTIDNPTKNVIIVDDLSSAGGTFMFASKLLSEAGYENIYLVVTHCENTMFENGQLLENDLIKKIYTTNSILDDKKYSHYKVVVENIL